jgi:hypothetical protein
MARRSWFWLSRHDDETAEQKAAREAAEADAAKAEADRKKAEEDALGEPGKRAIQAEREARSRAEKAAKDAQAAREAAEAKVKEFEDRDKSELEKVQAERDTAVKAAADAAERAKRAALRSAIVDAAAKAGALDPDDIAKLLPADAVSIDDDGVVSGAAEAIKALLDAKPQYKAAGKPGGVIDQGNREDSPTDFRKADKKDVDAELSKLGVSRW